MISRIYFLKKFCIMYMLSIYVSKPVLLGRISKYGSLQETDTGQYSGTVTVENTHQPRAIRKHSSSKDMVRLYAFVKQMLFETF